MQIEMSTQAPMLSRAVLRLLGMGLQGLYADVLEQPLPTELRNALPGTREVPHLLPGLSIWTHACGSDATMVGHQPVMAL